MSYYDEAVRRGMALLDERQPGWVDKIDLAKLRLASPCLCVLGQVYESYKSGKAALNLVLEEVVEHGFDIDEDHIERSMGEEYHELDDAWRRAIEARRAEGATG